MMNSQIIQIQYLKKAPEKISNLRGRGNLVGRPFVQGELDTSQETQRDVSGISTKSVSTRSVIKTQLNII